MGSLWSESGQDEPQPEQPRRTEPGREPTLEELRRLVRSEEPVRTGMTREMQALIAVVVITLLGGVLALVSFNQTNDALVRIHKVTSELAPGYAGGGSVTPQSLTTAYQQVQQALSTTTPAP